ncbi:MAG: hypothetical protein ACRDPY_29155 [Streptosporangiaceae bacterium]
MAYRSRVLATGGGFIGRAMASALLAEGDEVTDLVAFPDRTVRSVPALGAGVTA